MKLSDLDRARELRVRLRAILVSQDSLANGPLMIVAGDDYSFKHQTVKVPILPDDPFGKTVREFLKSYGEKSRLDTIRELNEIGIDDVSGALVDADE